MRITAYGAAGEVTGSCHLLEIGEKRVLIDCGQFQGNDEAYERSGQPFPFDATSIDAIILTHSHLDHIGRLPLLIKAGFRGEVLATAATREIGRLILMDAAHVMQEEYTRRLRKALRRGIEAEPPLYGLSDALLAVDRFAAPASYGSTLSLGKGASVTFRNAGHVLGSAFVEFDEQRNGSHTRVTFSGDLGYKGRDVMPDPTNPNPCDLVVSESTYGDRPHRPVAESQQELANAVKEAVGRGGNVVIPSFALERAQDVLYDLREMWEAGDMPAKRVFLDSPLAIHITDIYDSHRNELNPKMVARLDAGEDPFNFPGVEYTISTDDSKAINRWPSGSIIIAGSGMANGGRVLHHFRHNLWREDCAVIFVGYQARGTLGRSIVDGAKKVHIFGEEIAVRARVYTINGLSAHADKNGLVAWLRGTGDAEVLLVHGEPESMEGLASALRSELGRKVTIAELGKSYQPS
jgi:metallo-beta-lactamase family protein